jgi:hypothetical protein
MANRRSKLRRKSSPAGIQERLDARIASYLRVPADLIRGFRRPGSRNPRKAGR